MREIEFKDFQNPWTLHHLFTRDDDSLFEWLRNHGLLAERIVCDHGLSANLQYREKAAYNRAFRCSKGHEITMLKYSYFEGSPYNVRDLIIFIKYYIEGHTLKQCSLATSMEYKNTAVNWASYIRELFMEHVHRSYENLKFSTDVEIDESLFGRKIKYNRVDPRDRKFGFLVSWKEVQIQ